MAIISLPTYTGIDNQKEILGFIYTYAEEKSKVCCLGSQRPAEYNKAFNNDKVSNRCRSMTNIAQKYGFVLVNYRLLF